MKLIPNWQEAWKMVSVQLMALIALVAACEPYLPQLQRSLPDGWASYALPVVILARLIKQNNLGK